jgi:selenocysteine lyase/cysteine desulfurase
VADLKVKIITSKIEHHAVLYTVQALKEFGIQVDYVAVKWRDRYHEFSGTARGESKNTGEPDACQ